MSSTRGERFSLAESFRHVDGGEPGFYQAGPSCDGEFCRAQTEGMAAVRVEMNLRGDADFSQRDVVGERVVDVVDMIVFGLQEEGGWGLRGDVEIWIEAENWISAWWNVDYEF